MNFIALARGADVFLEANTFVFHFQPHPVHGPSSTDLLRRIEQGELTAHTTAHVLAEVAHRLMTIEARSRFGWSLGKLVQRLKQNPAAVQGLSSHETAVREVLQSSIRLIDVSPP